jgi:hypothetical protein
MRYEKIIVIGMVLFCAVVMAKVSKAESPNCKLEQPYRCVPVKGNAIVCGCGL